MVWHARYLACGRIQNQLCPRPAKSCRMSPSVCMHLSNHTHTHTHAHTHKHTPSRSALLLHMCSTIISNSKKIHRFGTASQLFKLHLSTYSWHKSDKPGNKHTPASASWCQPATCCCWSWSWNISNVLCVCPTQRRRFIWFTHVRSNMGPWDNNNGGTGASVAQKIPQKVAKPSPWQWWMSTFLENDLNLFIWTLIWPIWLIWTSEWWPNTPRSSFGCIQSLGRKETHGFVFAARFLPHQRTFARESS